jgi:hypothetical protein
MSRHVATYTRPDLPLALPLGAGRSVGVAPDEDVAAVALGVGGDPAGGDQVGEQPAGLPVPLGVALDGGAVRVLAPAVERAADQVLDVAAGQRDPAAELEDDVDEPGVMGDVG